MSSPRPQMPVTSRSARSRAARFAPLAALLLWTAPLTPALADLYTVERNGEITITNQPVRGGRVLHRVRDSGPAFHGVAPRRSGGGGGGGGGTLARASRFAATVAEAATHYGLPEALVWAVMKIESGFNPDVVSNKGAQGLMQLMPPTARDMGVTDPFDPHQNIYGGARLLRILANRFNGDLVLTLSAYHAGGGAVNSAGGIPFEQTAEYVRLVLNAYYAFQKELPARAP